MTETILKNDMNNEAVNHPIHYNHGSIEAIDYIQDCLGDEGCVNFCVGNAIKYIARARYKNNELEDYKKAIWYLEKAISIKDDNIGSLDNKQM